MVDLIGLYAPFKLSSLSTVVTSSLLDPSLSICLTNETGRITFPHLLQVAKEDGLIVNAYGLNLSTPVKGSSSSSRFTVSGLNAPYESLPSSFSGVSLKINHAPMIGAPHILLKASPAKLIQGHNVYGWDDLTHGIYLILDTLLNSCPSLSKHIDFEKIEIRMIDINYGFRLSNETEVKAILEYMKNISYKQTKATESKADHNTLYFGKRDSRHKFIRIYYKLLEITDKQKKIALQKKDALTQTNIDLLQNDYILKHAENLLRIEAAIRKEWIFNRYGSCLLKDVLSKCHGQEIRQLWVDAMKDIVKAIGDVSYKLNDEDLRTCLMETFYTTRINKDGEVKYSYQNANNIYAFYRLVQSEGYDRVKKTFSKNTFYRRLIQLEQVGISRATLQQSKYILAEEKIIIPFVDLVSEQNVVPPPHALPDYSLICSPPNYSFISSLIAA